MKTRAEVEALKREWMEDASYDITDVRGFEGYEEELRTFAQEQQALNRSRADVIMRADMKRMGLGSTMVDISVLYGYLKRQEREIFELKDHLDSAFRMIENLKERGN